MFRAAGVGAVIVAIAAGLTGGDARADRIDDRISELSSSDNYKLRIASVIALSKSNDSRALRALAAALVDSGTERSVRRVAVLGLSKQLPGAAAPLRAEMLRALERAASHDDDAKIRASADKAVRAIKKAAAAEVLLPDKPVVPGTLRGDAPKVFVNVDGAVDLSTKMTSANLVRLTNQVKKSVGKMGYATAWPGALPTSGDLRVNQARAYVVAATVKKLEIKRQSDRMTEVACTVAIRVAPWLGTDGKELWEADRAASASGSAKAQTGGSEREVAGGVRDCVEAVAEEISTRQVIPFLQRLVGS